MGIMNSSLLGCATGLTAEGYLNNTRDAMLSQGRPQGYIEGYLDGCSTGRRMAGDKKFEYKRNVVRADRDALYARGWQDGQIQCRNDVIAEEEAKCKEQSFSNEPADERHRRMEAQKNSSAEAQEMWEFLRK